MKNWVILSLLGGIVSAILISLGGSSEPHTLPYSTGMLVLGLSVGASFAALHYLQSARLWIAIGALAIALILTIAYYAYSSVHVVYARGVGLVVWQQQYVGRLVLFPGERCR